MQTLLMQLQNIKNVEDKIIGFVKEMPVVRGGKIYVLVKFPTGQCFYIDHTLYSWIYHNRLGDFRRQVFPIQRLDDEELRK